MKKGQEAQAKQQQGSGTEGHSAGAQLLLPPTEQGADGIAAVHASRRLLAKLALARLERGFRSTQGRQPGCCAQRWMSLPPDRCGKYLAAFCRHARCEGQVGPESGALPCVLTWGAGSTCAVTQAPPCPALICTTASQPAYQPPGHLALPRQRNTHRDVLVAAAAAVEHDAGAVGHGGAQLVQVGEGVGGLQGGDDAFQLGQLLEANQRLVVWWGTGE